MSKLGTMIRGSGVNVEKVVVEIGSQAEKEMTDIGFSYPSETRTVQSTRVRKPKKVAGK